MSYYLADPVDVEKHNEEVRQVWDSFSAGKPVRVPVVLGINPRVYLLNPQLNPERISFERYSADPDLMAAVQMRTWDYVRHNMLQDAEMGLPKDGWNLHVDSQNCFEAAWFGCPVEFRENQVPVTRPILNADNKRMLFDRGFPDPFSGGSTFTNWQFYERMSANLGTYLHRGLPAISVAPPGLGTDGPMTVAANLRGTTELCMEFYEDPDYVRDLLSYITEATIHRIRACREALGQDPKPQAMFFADDSIELLSVDMYRKFVLPLHKRLLKELSGDGPHGIHLCGDVDRLMPTLKAELNINGWDAGFPMDYGGMRARLGPDFKINTGPKVSLMLHGTPAEVASETRRILESGIAEGGRFVMREANNLSPSTPVENVAAMYHTTREYGKYQP